MLDAIRIVHRVLVWGLIVALALAAGFLYGAHHYQECVEVITGGRYTIL